MIEVEGRLHSSQSIRSCNRGCRATVPQELEAESICVQHFILGIESACAGMRQEAAMELATPSRRREIESYVKATAMKLSDVATSRTRHTDELKKKVLTTFLTLMNLQESLERSSHRFRPRPPLRTLPQTRMTAAMRG
jgi:hypothetical protein